MSDTHEGSKRSTNSVTVVIPAYNAASFLGRAIQSVLSQTYSHLQVLVIDDGSTDDTSAVAESFDDPRVKLITGAHRGVSAARNLGIDEAESEFVAFLDADDFWLNHKLLAQISYLGSLPDLVGVGALMNYVSTSGSVLGVAGEHIAPTELDAIARGSLMPFPMSSFVVRRDVAVEAGAFDESLDADVPGQVEDLDFLARVVQRGPVATVPEILGAYRIHSGSATMKQFASQQMGTRYVQARLQAAARGQELTWRAFSESYQLTAKERHRDRVRGWYRQAGVSLADRRWPAFIGFGTMAFLGDPRYTFQRALRQQRSRFKRS